MLDIAYEWLGSFISDCARCGLNAAELLRTGAYVECADGWIVAKEYV